MLNWVENRKSKLRFLYRGMRRALTDVERASLSEVLASNVVSLLGQALRGFVVGCYRPMDCEISLTFDSYDLGCDLVYPDVVGMHFVSSESGCKKMPDVCFVPLVAFDANCMRLGLGKGWYDRMIDRYPGCLYIGVGYHFQLHEPFLPVCGNDKLLHFVITDKYFYSGLPFSS